MKIFRFAAVLAIAVCLIVFGFLFGCADAEPGDAVFTVYAPEVDVVYDGREHAISVLNTIDGDIVYYAEGESDDFDVLSPAYVFPGEYVVRFKVIRPVANGFAQYNGSTKVTIRRSILVGISAEPVVAIYDGEPHNISVVGTVATDVVSYSLDGENFAQSFGVTEVGEYKIYYRVTGLYGDYASSCALVILPDIRGRYLNSQFGVIEVLDDSAIVGDEEFALVYGIDGKGIIGDKAFGVIGGVLTFDGNDYAHIAATDCAYRLICGDYELYFAAGKQLTVDICFEDGGAVLSLNGEDIYELDNVNYCDTTGSHKDDSLVVKADGTITRVELNFSLLPSQSVAACVQTIIYDGYSHELNIEYDGKVLYETDGVYVAKQPSFTEVGKYTVGVLYLRDGYLPFEGEATLYILSDISGAYYNSDKVAVITSSGAAINGVPCELATDEADWVLDGKRVEVTADGITVDGVAYKKRVDEKLLLIITNSSSNVIVHSEVDLTCSAKSVGAEILFEVCGHEESKLYEYRQSSESISATVNGGNKFTATQENGFAFVLGMTDINTRPVIIIEIE